MLFVGPIFFPLIFGTGQTSPSPTPTPFIEMFRRDGSSPDYYPFLIFDESFKNSLPILQEMASGASSDSEVFLRVVSYFEAHETELKEEWGEDNPSRLRAFYAMNLIHISHAYGANLPPWDSIAEYLNEPLSHCGPQSVFAGQIMGALGLEWRRVAISSYVHGWTEAKINGRWEIFDATSNVWISESGFELVKGQARKYRKFYTPWSDIEKPEMRQVLSGFEDYPGPQQYTPGALRQHMPGLGVYFFDREFRQRTGQELVVLD